MKTEAIITIVTQTPGLTAKEVAVSLQKDPKAKQQVAYFVLRNLVEEGVLTKATRPKDERKKGSGRNGAKLRAVIFDFLRGRRPFHV